MNPLERASQPSSQAASPQSRSANASRASAASGASGVAAAFRDTVERLHRRLGGAPDAMACVGEWAQRVWSATDEGHVCVRLPAVGAQESDRRAADRAAGHAAGHAADPAADHAQRALLESSPAVTCDPANRPAPLVLDLDAIYLHRWWLAETRLARSLAELDVADPVAEPVAIGRMLDSLFPQVDERDGQRRAVRIALERRLAVITGGPGTGKTTTLARLLVGFLRLRPGASVAFAAPTGKAAARLAQSLARQLPALDPAHTLGAALPEGGLTVHRLLGSTDAAGMLRLDLVIVDEASMLDVELASRLAASIPPHGRLVLAGDRDQLASVEAGAVFSELCASRVAGIARLDRNYRQSEAPAIAGLATMLRDADAAGVRAALDEPGQAVAAEFAEPPSERPSQPPSEPPSGVAVHPVRDAAQVARAALAAYEAAIEAVIDRSDPAQVLERFDRYRVLCALRGGAFGTLAINAAIASGVRRRVGAPVSAPWYPGRLVIVVRNEPDLGLFNGDVGICLPLPDHSASDAWDARADGGHARLGVAFMSGDAPRWLPVSQVPRCEDAFAMTVHKSQGSEFDCVAVIPAAAGHPLNTRELVYTAVTRARRALVLWSDAAAVAAAGANRTTRHGLLADRIGLALPKTAV